MLIKSDSVKNICGSFVAVQARSHKRWFSAPESMLATDGTQLASPLADQAIYECLSHILGYLDCRDILRASEVPCSFQMTRICNHYISKVSTMFRGHTADPSVWQDLLHRSAWCVSIRVRVMVNYG